jgi:outer membrane protein TolC
VATSGPPIVIQKGEQLDYVATATVPLVVPSGYPGLTAAKKTVAAARANYNVTETTLLYSVATAFYGAAGTDELVAARKHAIEVADQALKNAKVRFEAGVVNRVEVTRAQLSLVRAVQALADTENTRNQTYRSLATLIQLREPFRVAPTEIADGQKEPLADRASRALKLRPEFVALERNLDSQSAQRSSALWRWAPTLSGFGNVRAFNYAGFSGDKYAWAVGLQLDWVVYDGGARDAQRHQLDAQRAETAFRLSRLRDSINDEIANADESIRVKRQALDAAGQSVGLSRETLQLVVAQHDAGTATQLDLLQAQDALVAAEVALAQARFDLSIAQLTLERALGQWPPAGGGDR